MVDPVAEFNNALDRVPLILLGAEDARVLTDARTSVGVLDLLISAPLSVVFVGSTGVGKSYLVNGLAGTDVSPTGVLRPTTGSTVIVGSLDYRMSERDSVYVHVPAMRPKTVVADTPPWETHHKIVRRALSKADVGVLVVSPSRYADASTGDLWKVLQPLRHVVVVLNRLSGTPPERAEIISYVKEQFEVSDVVVVDEMGDVGPLLEGILAGIADDHAPPSGIVIARAVAVQAGRYVAGAVTASAVDLGNLSLAVEAAPRSATLADGLAVYETWRETRDELVVKIANSIDDNDRAIIDSAGSAIGVRMHSSMGDWQRSKFQSSLAEWRVVTTARFQSSATIRWRRSSTRQMVDQAAWMAGVNPTAPMPRRVRRVMGSDLDPATIDSRERLASLIHDAIEGRLDQWRKNIAEAASFKPGELLAACQNLDDE